MVEKIFIMKIGIIGSGNVAQSLARGFLKYDYDVMLGTGHPEKLGDFIREHRGVTIGSFKEAAVFGKILVLAVKGSVAESTTKEICDAMAGKTVIDATNPIDQQPPEDGVLHFFTTYNGSLMERLAVAAPKAKFVKAFNSVGAAAMVNPNFGGIRPTMFICGDSSDAKKEATTILGQFGWETEDMGSAKAARAIEPLCLLWCIPGYTKNDWYHAYKVLR